MLTIHDETFPLVSVQFTGTASLEDTAAYLTAFSGWLSRAEPFGLMVQQAESEEADSQQAHAAHETVVRWAKQHKALIAQSCVGMAMIVDLAKLPDRQRAMAPKVIHTLFGCPGDVFGNCAAAESWIRRQLDISPQAS